eukprot:1138666-Pelagomonas_calceolata.AAC.6
MVTIAITTTILLGSPSASPNGDTAAMPFSMFAPGLPRELCALADPSSSVALPPPGTFSPDQLDNWRLDKLVATLGRSRSTWRRSLVLYEWLKASNKPLDDRLCTTVLPYHFFFVRLILSCKSSLASNLKCWDLPISSFMKLLNASCFPLHYQAYALETSHRFISEFLPPHLPSQGFLVLTHDAADNWIVLPANWIVCAAA